MPLDNVLHTLKVSLKKQQMFQCKQITHDQNYLEKQDYQLYFAPFIKIKYCKPHYYCACDTWDWFILKKTASHTQIKF